MNGITQNSERRTQNKRKNADEGGCEKINADGQGSGMKLVYDRETDSLYIDLNARSSADSREVQDGVVLDSDAAGKIVGIDIQHASKILDLKTLETESLPAATLKLA